MACEFESKDRSHFIEHREIAYTEKKTSVPRKDCQQFLRWNVYGEHIEAHWSATVASGEPIIESDSKAGMSKKISTD